MISVNSLFHLVHHQLEVVEEMYLIQSQHEDTSLPNTSAIPGLLEEYKDVFEEPHGLPPVRGIAHQIVLKAGSEPKR